MKMRNSENPHEFQERLYNELHAYSCQGLLLDQNHNFSAVVEAVELDENEDFSLGLFDHDTLYAECILARELNVPFYIVCYKKEWFGIFEITEHNDTLYHDKRHCFKDADFAVWWGRLKQTNQVKKLENGGEPRINETIFDKKLREYGLEWGGNIDGFMLTESKRHVRCIIDNISVSHGLENDEPGRYFNSPNLRHGPRYDGWYAAVKCASTLRVPHLLFTVDKNNVTIEKIGLATISKLTPENISFKDDKTAKDQVLSGVDAILRKVERQILVSLPPELDDKYI